MCVCVCVWLLTHVTMCKGESLHAGSAESLRPWPPRDTEGILWPLAKVASFLSQSCARLRVEVRRSLQLEDSNTHGTAKAVPGCQ